MPARELDVHPEALEEALAGYAWYLERSERAADLFFGELDSAVDRIRDQPEAWPPFLHGTRRLVLTRFPYAVVYRQVGPVVVIYAFAHARRRPGYWRARLA